MLTLIVFVLLFNITYTQVLPGSLGGNGLEHKLEVKTSSDNKQSVNAPQLQPLTQSNSANAENHGAGQQAESNKGTAQHSQVKPVEENHAPESAIQKTDKNTDAVSNDKVNTLSKQDKVDTTKENKSSTLQPQLIPKNVKEDMQSGALLRGFYVFVGLSVVIMMYFIFRSYRLRHGTQPSTTVRKYGVTARRSDMEMRPLEMDDEDDDTIFEIGNRNTVR